MPEEQKRQPAPEDDLQKRIEGFNEEIKPILGKYELMIGSEAGLSPDGRIGSRVVLVSSRNLPKEKPPEAPAAPALTEG